MADKPWRLSMGVVRPCVFRAPTREKAIDTFIEYLKQPGTNRIIVEPTIETVEASEAESPASKLA